MNIDVGKPRWVKVRTMVNVWKRASAVAVMCLAAPLVSAADAPANTAAGPATTVETNPCDPCASPCPPACPTICWPTKSPKVVCKDATPKKIIVHQAEPIVEFRNGGPSRPVNVDRNVRPVGGDCHSCKGGAGHAGYPKVVKNFYIGGIGGCGHKKGHHGAGAYAYAPMAVQMQAYVPMAVTYAAPMAFAGPAAYGYAAGPAGYAYNGAGEGRPASDSSAAASAAQALQSAQAAAAATASFEGRLRSLETKMSSIENRLTAIERGIDVLCEERAKVRQ
jgi:hypothetical protein